ncbi:MAG: hypothetical protein AAF907_07845, partial [Planctomycetota bacterium]
FDVLQLGAAGRWAMVRLLPGLARTGPPTEHPHVAAGRCRSAVLTADSPLALHVDGELALVPDDAVRTVRLDLLPQRLRAKVCEPA